MNYLDVYAFQLTSIDDLDQNLANIEKLFKTIPQHSTPALICLPENALYMRVKEGEPVPAFHLEDECFKQLKTWAQTHQTWIHVGSVALQEQENLYNASIWISPQGQVFSNYKKIHLFDIELKGQKPIRESDVFKHGEAPHVYNLEGWQVGESICYDLRFSDLYHRYGLQGVDIILVPAAFLVKTGEAHWEVLLRARAIENQCYVIAAAQGGTHSSQKNPPVARKTYGHSLIIDPWGQILAQGTPEQTVIHSRLEKSAISDVRMQIPMAKHRRLHQNQLHKKDRL